MNLASIPESSLNSTANIKDEDINGILETFISTNKLGNARQLLNLIRNNRVKKIPIGVVNHLTKCALEEKLRPRLKEVCFLLLEHLVVNANLDSNNIGSASLEDYTCHMLTQGPEIGYDKVIVDRFETAIDKPFASHASKARILSFFSRLAAVKSVYLTPETIQSVSGFLVKWLHGTTSAEVFAKTAYTELDGVPSRDLFTVLNQVQTVMGEHLLHHQIFSMLRLWLHDAHRLKTVKQDLHAADGTMYIPLPAGAVGKFIEYSSRIIEQTNRVPSRPQDVSLQNACLLEALSLLNMLCLFDADNTPMIHQMVRQVFDKYCSIEKMDLPIESIPTILECLQFFLYHGDVVGYDVHTALDLFFRGINSRIIMDSIAANQIVTFLHANLSDLCYESNVLLKFFPQLMKIIAWNSFSFIDDFKILVPSFLSSNTALEVFHTILDLPCISVALLLQEYSFAKETMEVSSNLQQVYEASQNPTFRPMFNYILRSESGIGDTFSKIVEFHALLKPLLSHPRAIGCASTSCTLMETYLDVISCHIDEELAMRLIPAILERSVILLPIPNFASRIQTLMESTMLKTIKLYPSVITTHQMEILDYISCVRHLSVSKSIYAHVVWLIGEFMSTIYDKNVVAEAITTSYETLECALYEIMALYRDQVYSYKIMCMLAMAVTKLASRCQDLVPRVLLCLSKVLKETGHMDDDHQEYRDILCNRLNELIVILKMPNIMSSILSPPEEIEKGLWHKDNCSTTAVVKTVNTILG